MQILLCHSIQNKNYHQSSSTCKTFYPLVLKLLFFLEISDSYLILIGFIVLGRCVYLPKWILISQDGLENITMKQLSTTRFLLLIGFVLKKKSLTEFSSDLHIDNINKTANIKIDNYIEIIHVLCTCMYSLNTSNII